MPWWQLAHWWKVSEPKLGRELKCRSYNGHEELSTAKSIVLFSHLWSTELVQSWTDSSLWVPCHSSWSKWGANSQLRLATFVGGCIIYQVFFFKDGGSKRFLFSFLSLGTSCFGSSCFGLGLTHHSVWCGKEWNIERVLGICGWLLMSDYTKLLWGSHVWLSGRSTLETWNAASGVVCKVYDLRPLLRATPLQTRPISSFKSMCLTGLTWCGHPDRAQQFVLASGMDDSDMKPRLLFLAGLSKSLMDLPRDPVLSWLPKRTCYSQMKR